MKLVPAVAFVLFAASGIVGWFLLARFVKLLKSVPEVPGDTVENLSHLLLSGSGGMKQELAALGYLLNRRYSNIPNGAVVRAGDHALTAWVVTLVLLVVCGLAMAVYQ